MIGLIFYFPLQQEQVNVASNMRKNINQSKKHSEMREKKNVCDHNLSIYVFNALIVSILNEEKKKIARKKRSINGGKINKSFGITALGAAHFYLVAVLYISSVFFFLFFFCSILIGRMISCLLNFILCQPARQPAC